jgi:Ca2+-binding EF-hand superfamily protein
LVNNVFLFSASQLPRIIAVFDDDGTDSVNFSRFVRILSVFRPECDKEEKIECMPVRAVVSC